MQSPFVWEFDLDESQFDAILDGKLEYPGIDKDWAIVRLLDYGSYSEIVSRLGFKQLLEGWPRWRPGIKNQNRIRGLDFLAEWLPKHFPDVIE